MKLTSTIGGAGGRECALVRDAVLDFQLLLGDTKDDVDKRLEYFRTVWTIARGLNPIIAILKSRWSVCGVRRVET